MSKKRTPTLAWTNPEVRWLGKASLRLFRINKLNTLQIAKRFKVREQTVYNAMYKERMRETA